MGQLYKYPNNPFYCRCFQEWGSCINIPTIPSIAVAFKNGAVVQISQQSLLLPLLSRMGQLYKYPNNPFYCRCFQEWGSCTNIPTIPSIAVAFKNGAVVQISQQSLLLPLLSSNGPVKHINSLPGFSRILRTMLWAFNY